VVACVSEAILPSLVLALVALRGLMNLNNKIKMEARETLYRVKTKEVDFKNMPNNEDFYFVIDLAYGKRVHRCGHIKAHPNNFLYVFLDKTQLTYEQRSAVGGN